MGGSLPSIVYLTWCVFFILSLSSIIPRQIRAAMYLERDTSVLIGKVPHVLTARKTQLELRYGLIGGAQVDQNESYQVPPGEAAPPQRPPRFDAREK